MASSRSSASSSWSCPSTLMPTPAAVAQRVGDVGGVERGDGGRHLRHVLAEARAERAVVGLDLVGAELVGLRDEAQLLDVELGLDDAPRAARSPRARRRPPPPRRRAAAGARRAWPARGRPARAARSRARRPSRPRARRRAGRPRGSRTGGRSAPSRRGCRRSRRRRTGRTAPAAWPPSTRQVCSVPKAAGSPSQKRARERRTYQFERSSTNAAIAWPARVAS